MMIKELGGNSTKFDRSKMKRVDLNKPLELSEDGIIMQPGMEIEER